MCQVRSGLAPKGRVRPGLPFRCRPCGPHVDGRHEHEGSEQEEGKQDVSHVPRHPPLLAPPWLCVPAAQPLARSAGNAHAKVMLAQGLPLTVLRVGLHVCTTARTG
jgi:hypothetical protein